MTFPVLKNCDLEFMFQNFFFLYSMYDIKPSPGSTLTKKHECTSSAPLSHCLCDSNLCLQAFSGDRLKQ